MTKSQIRSYQKELRNKLSPGEQKSFSTSIRENLFQTEAYRISSRVFTFVSFGSEVDTLQIIKASLENGKKVYLPRVEAHGMEFYEIHTLEGLITSKFGVPEPPVSDDKRYDDTGSQGNLMLMPGLAFDTSGNRIGYGAGYYDRYLAKYTEANFYKAALAYEFQLMEKIPADEFDIKADIIITPKKIYHVTDR